MFISKPCIGRCGVGIKLIKNIKTYVSGYQENQLTLVQKYIENPVLIDGYKFDIRLYVLVYSIDPLIIYLYDDGLIRFATQQYSHGNGDIGNQFVHLTNYTLNKNSPDFIQNLDSEKDYEGSK